MNRRWSHGLLVVILLAVAALACELPGGAKPSVVINSPPNDYEVSEGEGLVVDVSAQGGGKIERVELLVDDELADMSISPSPPASLNAQLEWMASGVGKHTVKVKAYNTDGQVSDAAVIMVNVVEGVAVATPSGEATATPGGEAVPTPAEETATAAPTNTPTVTPTGTLAPPVAPVLSFWVDSNTVKHGQPFTLSWHEENATALYLSGSKVGTDVAVTGPDGSEKVCSGSVGCPDIGDQLYVLRAEGPGGVTEKSVTVHITLVLKPLVPIAISGLNFTATYTGAAMCPDKYLEFSITNTGTVALESVSVTIVRMPSQTPIGGSQKDGFHSPSKHCGENMAKMDPGNSAWTYGYVSSAAPGDARAYIKICTQDGLGGGCAEKTVDFTF